MFSGTAQVSHQVCQFFCQFCWVPWDDTIVELAGKLRKLWDSQSELHSSLCERRLERTVLRPALLPVKTAQFTQFFRQVWRYTVKSLSSTESGFPSGLSVFLPVLLSALRWYHRGVGRQTEETVGFPEWTAQFFVWKTTGKNSSEACVIACQNCTVYSIFPSGMTSHSKIAQFNWECIGRLRPTLRSRWLGP
jgi:hypothetical protein